MKLSEELKKSVLQAAMQGKLTEQLPSDGSTETLFDNILSERESLIKAKKIKKAKKLPDIKELEIPYDIPKNWKWVRLNDVGDWGAGATPLKTHTEYYVNGDVPWLLTGDLNDSYINHTNKFITKKALQDTSVSLKPKGSVLIAMYGATIGKLGILNIEATTNQACCACIPFHGVYNKFLFYFLMSHKNNFIKQGEGGAQPNISRVKIVKTVFPLPPLEEQHRIVEKLDELMEQIDELEKSEKKLEKLEKEFPEDMKASLLQAAMQGKLTKQMKEDGNADDLLKVISEERAKLVKEKKIKKSKPLPQISEDEIPFDIPDNWRWVRFGNILNIVSAKRVHKSDWQKSGIPFYRAREIAKLAKDNQVDNDLFISEELFDELSKYGIPEPNDLMVTGVGTLGKTYIVKSNDKFYYKDASVLCMKNYGHISSDYIKSVMESPYMQKEIKKSSSGTTVGTLTIIRLSNYLFPLPPLAEQHRIVKKLDELLPLCETSKRRLTAL